MLKSTLLLAAMALALGATTASAQFDNRYADIFPFDNGFPPPPAKVLPRCAIGDQACLDAVGRALWTRYPTVFANYCKRIEDSKKPPSLRYVCANREQLTKS